MGLPTVRVGVDIGGTFTDVALQGPDGLVTGKVLTDYAQPERAILAATLAAARQAGIAPGDIGQVIHGTTLVTNALIERRGARMAFITTEGFRDVIEMRSENRFEQYDLNLSLPLPMVPRKDRFTLKRTHGAEGARCCCRSDPAEARAMAERIVAAATRAVAIGLMHAYANPAHGGRWARLSCARAFRGVRGVALLCRVSPLDARVAPGSTRHRRHTPPMCS